MELPRAFNAAQWFVDRHVDEGRDGRLAIIHAGGTLTYGDVCVGVNRCGNMLRRLGVATTVLGIAPERLLFPVPQAERDVNPNLTQNPGY